MRNSLVRWLLLPACLLLGFTTVQAQTPPILFQHPTVNATHIVFSYAGSLWSVKRQGGVAHRLTAGAQVDSRPIFSPNGNLLAFTGDNHGNLDVYVMPADGGPAKRLTWYPGPDMAVGWTNNGERVLFRSMRYSVDMYYRLFTVSIHGGLPSAISLPYASQGSYSPNGQRLAYVPFRNHPWFETWKHYRGGMQPRIRIAQLSNSAVVSLPRGDANNQDPMWVGNAIYFISDRTGGHYRLYRYSLRTKQVKAISPNDGHDILSVTAGALDTSHPAIVYAQMGKLFLYDVKSGHIRQVHVAIHADFPGAAPHWDTVGKQLRNPDISPRGVRAVFQAHGDILTVPTKHGDPVDITRTPGAAERYPAWSPNGKWIAYFSDALDHYELYISPQTGIGRVKKFNLGPHPSYYFDPIWSPNSRYIAFHDVAQHLWIVNVETGKLRLVATRYYDEEGRPFFADWSADSQWLTYVTVLPNDLHAVFVYSMATGKSTQITDGMSDTEIPRFDPSGKYLYFLASTNPNPSGEVGELSSYDHPTVYSAYVAVLRSNLPSPLAPRPGNAETTPATTPKTKKPASGKPVKVTIDFTGLKQRILALPVPPRSYDDLEVSAPGIVWLAAGPVVRESRPDHPGFTIYRFSLKKRKETTVLQSVQNFVLSADGKHMLIQQGPHWSIVPATAHVSLGAGMLNTSHLQVYVVPHEQWREMFHDVWLIERNFFYSPQFNGLSIRAASKYYSQFLPGVESRSDVFYLFHDMLGNMTVSHMFLIGSPYGHKPISVGLLGADYTIDHNRYRFSRIFSGQNWNPGLHAPLTQPGVNVKVGDYLLAVDGRALYGSDNIYSFFENTAGKQVVITVGPNPDGTGSQQVTVVPVGSEAALRKRAWIHHNRMIVDKLSHGKLAYVYLPDTATGGWTYFNRYYFSQIGKQGVVVDERFNHGGDLANYIVNQLTQSLLNFWRNRNGHIMVTPATIFGPKVMIANHFAGSGGDYLPYIFKMERAGTLVGTRTWGGLVGIGRYPILMNGNRVTAPEGAIYFPNGKWDVENHGVTPNVQVRMNPELWREGKDPQLQTAVAIAMRELKAHPWHIVPPPPYPNYDRGTPLGRSGSGSADLSPIGRKGQGRTKK